MSGPTATSIGRSSIGPLGNRGLSILDGHNPPWFGGNRQRGRSMLKIAKRSYAAALISTFGLAWISPQALARVEETDPSVSYTIGWTQGDTSGTWSGGTAPGPPAPGPPTPFTFTRPSVRWRRRPAPPPPRT